MIYIYVAFCNAQVSIYVWNLRSLNVKLLFNWQDHKWCLATFDIEYW